MGNIVPIDEVEIDPSRGVLIRPRGDSFEYVYRAGAGVRWYEADGSLAAYEVGTQPPEWWFHQILKAVAAEYGADLVLQSGTRWKNVSASQRAAMEAQH